ncbi:efflux transporter outer membrane subunit [Bradyrhizobium sp. dw_78]|uniref:efflux transporter outer membrane subunit n=1 Tax=Bradyrhizobium sp. dw_78 TaxID=2719793 RepID=UPI001BD4F7FA|nr:efflux transporter outer membrane subunit [Bradyrhizobium sp. dw_78]
MLALSFRISLRRIAPRSTAWAVTATLGIAVAGCTVGPDFEAPESPSVTRYISPSEINAPARDAGKAVPTQAITVGEKVAADWWKLFRSSDLDLLVKQAIAGNRSLESVKQRLVAAREAVAVARSALYPQVGLGASAQEEKQSAATFGLSPNAFPLPPSFNLFQVGPTASYTPDLFGGTHRRIEQQSALAEYQSDQLDAAYLTLTGNTVSLALQVATARSQLKALNDILAIDRQNVELVRKQRQAGTVPDSDVIVAESQLAADETLQPGLEQQLSVAKHALAVLIGLPPGDWSPPNFELAVFALPHRLPVSIPSEFVHQRPDIHAAEAQLHAASAQIGIATAQLYPSITLSAGINASSLNGGDLFTPSGLVWSVASGLTQPIFDGGMREAERREALAAFKASAADYQQTVLQAFGQVADILQALTHDTNLLVAQKHALSMASEAVRLQRINYGSGGSGIIGLLDAQRQYQQAQLGYIRAEAQRYQDTVQLMVAMGGGWWDQKLASTDNDHNLAHNDPHPSQIPITVQH